jgi:EpsI family protein
MRFKTAAIAVPVMLAAQAWLVHGFVGVERVPLKPELNRLAVSIDGWKSHAEIPIPPATIAQLGADATLERLYVQQDSGVAVDLLVGWFQSQRGGATQPHSPQVCLPGSGWLALESRVIMVNTSLGAIPMQRFLVSNRGQRALTLYWYQSPRRVLTGEWEARFFTFADGLRDQRTDTAIVRVFATLRPGETDVPQAASFASSIYPLLRQLLPR